MYLFTNIRHYFHSITHISFNEDNFILLTINNIICFKVRANLLLINSWEF